MSEELDKELQAISTIIKALQDLEVDEKKRVIEYALTRLGLKVAGTDTHMPRHRETVPLPPVPEVSEIPMSTIRGSMVDIRALREEKNPRTAIEMATVVAFYLSELAPDAEQRTTVSTDDIIKYFKQASFKLPGGSSGGAATLRNAKNAGYLEPAGEVGTYKLTPVGYNLVAFNLPKEGGVVRQARKAVKKTAKPKKAGKA